MIANLRRMVAELTTTTYSDALVTAYIEKYPHLDEFGEAPLDFYGDPNSDWTPTYDLHGAAADIWEEKAVLKIEKFDFTADGGTFRMSQQYEFCMRQARVNRSRMSPRSARMVQSPAETSKYSDSWIGNLAESD
jgi:hypothetical protein